MFEALGIRFENKKRVFLFIIMLFFIAKPGYISNIAGGTVFNSLLTAGEYLVYTYIVIKWIYNRRISLVFLMTVLMYGVVIISTLYNGGGLVSAIKSVMGFVFMVMLMDNESDDISDLWQACVIYLSVMIVINYIAILVFPAGLYFGTSTYNGQTITTQTGWFMSVSNGLGKYILYTLFFKADWDLRRTSKLSPLFYLLSVVSILSLIAMDSTAALVSAAVMIAMIICGQLIHKMKPGIFNVYFFMGLLALFFVLFVILRTTGLLSGYFVNEVLGDNNTFHGRTTIWASVIERIVSRPLLGYGYTSKEAFRYLADSQAAVDAHNQLLTLGVFGGLLAMALLVLIIILAARSIRTKQYEYTGIVTTAFFFAFFMTMLFENTTSKMYWIIIAYAFYLGKKELMPEGVKPIPSGFLGWNLVI